jgi:phage regulator Rha-like protein
MTKDGFMFLCMGWKGEKASSKKEAYIAEFNRMAGALNSISDRVNKLSIEGKQIKELGAEWSRLGHEVDRFKKKHKEASNSLMSEVQLKLEI